jgi:hypothetical protein
LAAGAAVEAGLFLVFGIVAVEEQQANKLSRSELKLTEVRHPKSEVARFTSYDSPTFPVRNRVFPGFPGIFDPCTTARPLFMDAPDRIIPDETQVPVALCKKKGDRTGF